MQIGNMHYLEIARCHYGILNMCAILEIVHAVSRLLTDLMQS